MESTDLGFLYKRIGYNSGMNGARCHRRGGEYFVSPFIDLPSMVPLFPLVSLRHFLPRFFLIFHTTIEIFPCHFDTSIEGNLLENANLRSIGCFLRVSLA